METSDIHPSQLPSSSPSPLMPHAQDKIHVIIKSDGAEGELSGERETNPDTENANNVEGGSWGW